MAARPHRASTPRLVAVHRRAVDGGRAARRRRRQRPAGTGRRCSTSWRRRGTKLGALSDYPAMAKLEALGHRRPVRHRAVGAGPAGRTRSSRTRRACWSRSEALAVEPAEAVYVGDRAEVDGVAAARRPDALRARRRFRRASRARPHRRDRRPEPGRPNRWRRHDRRRPHRVSRRRAVAALSGRPTLKGHLSILRPDHWFKQVFALPGIAAALSDSTGDDPRWDLGPDRRRVRVAVPRGVEQLRHQRAARRAVGPLPPDQAPPARAVRAGQRPAGRTSSGSPSMVVGVGLGFLDQRAVRVHDAGALGDGVHLQHPADPLEGPPVPRRAVGVDQQPAADARRLVHDRHRRLRPDVAAPQLLVRRLLLHGHQAVRGVQRDRRSRAGGGVPEPRSRTTRPSGCSSRSCSTPRRRCCSSGRS